MVDLEDLEEQGVEEAMGILGPRAVPVYRDLLALKVPLDILVEQAEGAHVVPTARTENPEHRDHVEFLVKLDFLDHRVYQAPWDSME